MLLTITVPLAGMNFSGTKKKKKVDKMINHAKPKLEISIYIYGKYDLNFCKCSNSG